VPCIYYVGLNLYFANPYQSNSAFLRDTGSTSMSSPVFLRHDGSRKCLFASPAQTELASGTPFCAKRDPSVCSKLSFIRLSPLLLFILTFYRAVWNADAV